MKGVSTDTQNLNPGQDTRANKPRNEHTNADTKAHTKALTSTAHTRALVMGGERIKL